MQTFSNVATTSANGATTSVSTPLPLEEPSSADVSAQSNTWIAGVVVGPVLGLGLGAVLMWYCLRRRRESKAQHEQQNMGFGQVYRSQQELPSQIALEKYTHTVKMNSHPWQQQTGHQDYSLAEAPGHSTPAEPAELWNGNYR